MTRVHDPHPLPAHEHREYHARMKARRAAVIRRADMDALAQWMLAPYPVEAPSWTLVGAEPLTPAQLERGARAMLRNGGW